MKQSREVKVSNWVSNGQTAAFDNDTLNKRNDQIATELPVALTYNRLSHVVMMVTPTDLENFALGFSLTEGLVGSPDDLLSVKILPREGGMEVAITVTEQWFDRLSTQRRNLTGRTGCGLMLGGIMHWISCWVLWRNRLLIRHQDFCW